MSIFKFGFVSKLDPVRKFGLIKDLTNKSIQYIFFFTELTNEKTLKISDRVKFIAYSDERGNKAKSIFKVADKSINSEEHLDLIKKIDNEWRQEGLHEDNTKLFYYIDEIDQIISGSKCFVIGRKGTGKTAIAEYLYKRNSFDTYTEKLSFQSFPIYDLYDKKDSSYSLQNQYITVWKHIIYGSVLKMMSFNESIDSPLLKSLRILFPLDPVETLERKIKSLNELELTLSLAGNTIKTTKKKSNENKEISAIEKAQLYEDIIVNYLDKSSYFIIIDALDDDYSDLKGKDQYFFLLNGLFKAVQEIKSIFPNSKYKIYPVVFLRDDIYSQINDSDKTKWRDLMVRIYWTKIKIQNLLYHRIRKTTNQGDNTNFTQEWGSLFLFSKVYINKEYTTVFEALYDQSFIRPRDFIVFIKLCCERALKNKTLIDEEVLFKTFDSFSKYLLEDIEFEIKPLIPEINAVFSILEKMRKKVFTFHEFEERFKHAVEKGNIVTSMSSEKILEVLYNFSIIGNLTLDNLKIFKFYSLTSSLNIDESIIIKNGLQLALRV